MQNAKGVPKSKKVLAISLAVVLAPSVFFALRSGKHNRNASTADEINNTVIIHTGTAYQGDMDFYIDALGTVTPISMVNIYS
jgi:hypothetical protein